MGLSFYYSCLTVGAIFAIGLLRAHAKNTRRNPKRLPLPPGPKGLPIIGNLLDIPTRKQWAVFGEWSKVYGDIMHLNAFGQSIIILCSTRRTTDLLDKRSSIYSSRPRLPMMGCDCFFSLLPYGARWRRHRRLFHEHFHMNVVSKYFPIQSQETRRLLLALLKSPKGFRDHIRHAFASTIMNVTYGIKVKERNDPYLEAVEEAVKGIIIAGAPGAFLVDFMPILKYVPEWMPGAGFKKKAAYWRNANYRMAEDPWRFVKSQHSQGTAPDSVAAACLDGLPPIGHERREEEEVYARNTAAVAFVGGSDTTLSSFQALFLAMALCPDAQRKAQVELDSVVGNSRLPDLTDRDSLPYVNAVIKEVMRWHNVFPLALPHTTTSDDEYDGYFIPKGSTVMGNTWFILHDPEIYDQPFEFRPERFLKDGVIDENVQDPEVAAFGFGRRICPGRHFSNNALFNLASSVLSVFTISPAKDEHGNAIPIYPGMTDGLASYPTHFDCEIKPRSAAAEALIRDCQGLI
ncbi:cytochrome P450 [Infundibulicybe gibba]|nr:cytochrome P450 [Infundibulicybe gibba]